MRQNRSHTPFPRGRRVHLGKEAGRFLGRDRVVAEMFLEVNAHWEVRMNPVGSLSLSVGQMMNTPWCMKTTKLLLVLLTTAAVFIQAARAVWTPPDHPEPSKILQEAQADAKAGHYEDALAKQVWFHENALKYQPSQTGVRLSFALMDWVELGAFYPTAIEKLKSIRDEDGKAVRETTTPKEVFQPFNDFTAINSSLHDEDKTTELFQWLDVTKPLLAQSVFNLAEPALIKAKEFQLCGKYIKSPDAFEHIVNQYKTNKKLIDDPRIGKQFQAYTEKNFSHSTATLVAMLVINNRKVEADQIATEAEKEWDDADFKIQLEEAEKGNVPPPWP